MDEMLKDSRFAHIAKDPKFRRIPRAERKVKIDKRFQSMFKDKKFTVNYTIDKRGRPVNQTSTENLRKYYELSSSEEESDDESSATEEAKDKPKNVKETKTKKSEKKKKKNVDITSKQQKDGSIKHNDINKKEVQSEDENESKDEEDDDDHCISTNGALLRIKPKEDTDKESAGKSVDNTETSKSKTTKNDLLQNEKQLQIRRKNEATKLTEEVKKKLKDLSVNYARGEGVLLSDSSSDDESSEYSDDGEQIDHNWGELDKEADTTDQVSLRLAACNMDWDRIRAVDLMVLFNSFLPAGGLIRSVTIYPSEFGLERMKEEEVSGPIELTQPNEEFQEENEDGTEYHMEKLRKYQLNRLKYYYAVIVFDSKETANKIYTECDGIEYESTATKVDLRFIPDDMEFDQEPKEICTEIPEFTKYQPRQFTTTALQQVKVELTWDEMNPERKEFTQKLNSGKIDEIDQNDLQAYLASETSDEEPELNNEEKKSGENKSDSEEESNADPIEKYKSLLKEIEDKEEEKQKNEVELEFTWGLGAKEKAEKLVKERLKKDENLTPFEQYLEKRKAKKKAKRDEKKKLQDKESNLSGDSQGSASSDDDLAESSHKKSSKSKSRSKKKTSMDDDSDASSDNEDERRKGELELLLMDENDDEKKQHFNMKKIEENETMSKSKQKRLKKKNKEDDSKADDFKVDVKDSRFNALFTSHHYNIDPADPHYRKTKGTEALITEKLKRRNNDVSSNEVKPKQPKTDKKLNTELQALVKSVKKNTQNISKPIK